MDTANNSLKEIKELLNSFEKEMHKKQEIWKSLETKNSNFSQVSGKNWLDKQAPYWLHGTSDIQECNKLESSNKETSKKFQIPLKPKNTSFLATKTAQKKKPIIQGRHKLKQHSLHSSSLPKKEKPKALTHYQNWIEHILENCTYANFSKDDLSPPEKNDTLYDYTWKRAIHVQKNGWGSKENKRALRSFLSYLRKNLPKTDIAFLEHIFPEKMDLRHGFIIRLIKPQVNAISEEIAAKIIKTLTEKVLYGRTNAFLKNSETLALCWICLASSRLKLPTTLECLHAIRKNTITINEKSATIKIPTIFGPKILKISKKMATYLKTISNISSTSPRKTIFQSTLHDLRRSLKSAIKKAAISSDLGKITFLTFMSAPHYAGKNIRSGKQFPSKIKTVL